MAGAGAKVTKLSWTVAGGLAAWAVARASAADRVRRAENVAVPLISFTPQVARAAPWAVLGLRLTGRRGPAAAATLAAAALGAVVRPRQHARPQPGTRGPGLRVLTLNLFAGRADTAAVVALVRQVAADVLFVQELTDGAVTRLKQAGLDDLLPHTQLELRGGPRGSGIYSRFPLSEGPFAVPAHAAQPTALLTLPGGRPLVMAGDFNATLDHAAFRDVLRLGYADSAQQTGSGLIPTWGPPGRGAVLTLDHVLVDQACAVLGYAVHLVPGSDHRALSAEIRLPR